MFDIGLLERARGIGNCCRHPLQIRTHAGMQLKGEGLCAHVGRPACTQCISMIWCWIAQRGFAVQEM